MPTPDQVDDQQQQQQQQQQQDDEADNSLSSDSDSSSESEFDSDSEPETATETTTDLKKKKKPEAYYTRPGEFTEIPSDDDSPEANLQRFTLALNSRRLRRAQEEDERRRVDHEDLFNFPRDPENWREEDLQELWADAPLAATKPGWDPVWADDEDWGIVQDEIREGKDPTIAPFYLPYRKHYPVIPDNHYDISNPKAVVEELDRIEEFLRWVSYIFPDGSSYEGTVWDDLAHGKGVYVAEQGLVRYEGEWLQNNMEGHGVVEVEIPDIEPIPGSKLEAQMRSEGKIIKRDYMNPEDREWLEMDIEDSVRFVNGNYEIPFYENDEWIRQYGQKPEKGRYRYAGQWKHSRMHGCGVYEVNERTIYGRFYFGELAKDSTGCDEETSALHSGIAEVAAAKARMFVNKPDGMVREERGPYGDPQHPYFYEEEDVWQAPGFINQFYEVPDYWKTYVHEVDEEREMWLNSFYRAPLRLPMPAELEYWWEKDAPPEFVLLNKEPEPDPNDPSKVIYTEDPVILHTPTGRIINYVEDEEHGIRMFWQPLLKEGEDVDPTKVEFLPVGFDEFYGRETVVKKEGFWKSVVSSVENACKPWFDRLEKWTEEQKEASKIRKEIIEQELELIEAELCLEEALEDMEEELKQEEKEAEKAEADIQEEEVSVSPPSPADQQSEKVSSQEEIEEEEEDDEEDDSAPSSFGSVAENRSSNDKRSGSEKSPFSSLSIASSGVLSAVPLMIEKSFSAWKKERCPLKVQIQSFGNAQGCMEYADVINFSRSFPGHISLRVKSMRDRKHWVKQPARKMVAASQSNRVKDHDRGPRSSRLLWLHGSPETTSDHILSLNVPLSCLDSCLG